MADVLTVAGEKMNKTVENFKDHLLTIRTGRANAGILESVRVDYYGAPTPLNQMSAILIPDPRTIEIKPYDNSQLASIEKAILAANIGLTPQNDGKVVRLKVPPLTEDRRSEFVKLARKMGEDAKVVLRQERRDAVDRVKNLLKDKSITEDEQFRLDAELQKLTDAHIKKVDELVLIREKEIMTV